MIQNKLDIEESNKQSNQIPILLSTQTKSQTLYNYVIQKNFTIIADLLKKLQFVYLRHEELETEFINFNKRIGKMEIDIDTIHNEHRRNNFLISSTIEDLKFEINGIDNHVKIIYQDYRKKGHPNLIKSSKNLMSQSGTFKFQTLNRNILNQEKTRSWKIEQLKNLNMEISLFKKSDQRETDQNKVQKIETNQQRSELSTKNEQNNEKKRENIKKRKQYKKKPFRQSQENKFQQISQTEILKQNQINRKSYLQELEINQNQKISEINREGPLRIKNQQNEKRNICKTKKNTKYSEIIRNPNYIKNLNKQNRNSAIVGISHNNGFKNNKWGDNRYQSQIKYLPSFFQQQSKHYKQTCIQNQTYNLQLSNSSETFLQNYDNLPINRPCKSKTDSSNIKYVEKLEQIIKPLQTRMGQLDKNYQFLDKKLQSFVTLDKYVLDMCSHFNQIKSFRDYVTQNFANKSETKKAILFINQRIKNLVQIHVPHQQTPNSYLQDVQNSSIISKCLGCNRLADLTEENKKSYTISPTQLFQQKKKSLIENKNSSKAVDPAVNMNDFKKRAISLLKSNQRKNFTIYKPT